MNDFDIILGMDFLGRNNAINDCYHRKVIFKPNNSEKFFFKGRSLLNRKMIISSMQAQMMLANRCMSFLASVVDKSKEKKLDTTEVPVVREFVKIFPKELPSFPPPR